MKYLQENKIYNMDCLQGIKKIKSKRTDLFVGRIINTGNIVFSEPNDLIPFNWDIYEFMLVKWKYEKSIKSCEKHKDEYEKLTAKKLIKNLKEENKC